jgi:BASS family bile acid:Na+ symporter
MAFDDIVSVLVKITLVEMMILIGLQITFLEIVNSIKEWRLVTRAAVANYVIVPGATLALLILLDVNPKVAMGFLILAVCPGAPYGPPFARIARANVQVSVGLMTLLAGSSALISPILLEELAPLASGAKAPRIELIGILSALLTTQLLPLLLGLLIKHQRPQLAERMQAPFDFLSKLLNLTLVVLILGSQFYMLTEIKVAGFIGMLILLIVSLFVGWIAGGSRIDYRKSVALTTSLRNVGVGLVIVTGNFSGTPAVAAVMAYGIVEVIGSLLVAVWWRRSSSTGPFKTA